MVTKTKRRGPVLLTDLDNTIYNWVDFFAPCFRAMVHALARETGLEEATLTAQFREVYSRHSSVEYAFSVQELELCRDMPSLKVERLVRLARGAFDRVREKRLRAYPEVASTLEWAARSGLEVIGVSNAPIFHAEWRLSQLRLSKLFTGLAALGDAVIPEDRPWEQAIKAREEAGGYPSPIQRKWRLAADELKPSPVGYLRILESLNLSHKQAYVIGDSLQKDVSPALAIGAQGIWARYGTVYDPKNWSTLLEITHWDEAKVAATYGSETIEPSATVESFAELRRLVHPPQASLFGEEQDA